MTVNRRSIVKGAAWTIPAAAVSVAAPAFAASGRYPNGTSTTTQGIYYHTLFTRTPAGCNPATNPQFGYIDNLPYRSPAGNSNANRDPNSSNGFWVEGTAGTVTNIDIAVTYTFNRDITLTPTGNFGGTELNGWSITQVDARTVQATYHADVWEVSTATPGSGDATGFFQNFVVAEGCYPKGSVRVTTNTLMTYYDASGMKTFTKKTGPSGV